MAEDTSFAVASEFVEDGRIRYAALFSTILSAGWLVLAGGFITVMNAIVTVHVSVLETAQTQWVRIISAILGGGAELSRTSWAVAFESAVETAPLLAPLLLALELVLVWLVLGELASRQELI